MFENLRHIFLLPCLGAALLGNAQQDMAVATDGSPDELAVYLKDVDPTLVRQEDGLVIWPVPARDELYIHCNNATGNMPFEIVDLTGKVVLRGSVVGGQVNLVEFGSAAKGDNLLRVVDRRSIRSIAFQRTDR